MASLKTDYSNPILNVEGNITDYTFIENLYYYNEYDKLASEKDNSGMIMSQK